MSELSTRDSDYQEHKKVFSISFLNHLWYQSTLFLKHYLKEKFLF